MGKKKNKNPKSNINPQTGKKVPKVSSHTNVNQRQFRWSVKFIDLEGRWGWDKICIKNLFETVISKLLNFETMKWSEIEGNKNHLVDVQKLHKEAKHRLREQKIVASQLFSLRITGEQRIWGHRDRDCFYLLWWDPNHEVCPSKKKHT